MSKEQSETPLEKFRKKIQAMKDVELEKKHRRESGETDITWNPAFKKIDGKTLGEEERFVFENLNSLSREEFEGYRRKRMEDMGIIQPAGEAEKIIEMEGLNEQQRGVMRRVIKISGRYVIKTPEQESLDSFWQYMANRFISEGRKENTDSL